MPLEIRELVIKVNIESAAESSTADLQEQLRELEDRLIEKCLEEIERKIEKGFDR